VGDCLLRECYLHLKHKLHAELADGTRAPSFAA
jgi:hypothetical protein